MPLASNLSLIIDAIDNLDDVVSILYKRRLGASCVPGLPVD
jgi:hypothetical protein